MSLGKIDEMLTSLASLLEAKAVDPNKTQRLPKITMPGKRREPNAPKAEPDLPPDTEHLVADVDFPTLMRALMDVDRSIEKFTKAHDQIRQVVREVKSEKPADPSDQRAPEQRPRTFVQPKLAKAKKLKDEMLTQLQELTKHVNEVSKALD